MTTKRNRGFTSLDLVLPVASHYRTDPQVIKDVETMRTNAASRWAKDDYSNILSGYHNTSDNLSKIATLARPKVEILRANSPTFKRLLAVRVKLEKYFNSIARSISASRQSTRSVRETPYPTVYDKQPSTITRPVHVPPTLPSQPPPPPPPAAPPTKPIKSKSSLDNGPLDKITYEKTWTRSGNMKQKCSLEIWLPKPSLDDDGNTSRTVTPDMNIIEKNIQPIALIKSRRSSVVKITATSTVMNIETKSMDETSSKKSDSIVIPRVYHYGDYIMDLPEERPRSSKSITTVKSDGAGSNKSAKRQYTRPHTRRQSVSTNHSEEILRFGTTEVPISAKNLSIDTKSTSPNREVKATVKPSNPSMVHELIQKYSLIKKSHEELTQAKLQLEKPNNDLKSHSARSRPPPVPESTSIVSPDQPTVSVRKLLIDTSPTRSATDHSSINTKLLDRRSTPRKPSHSDIYPQLRIFSLANQQQHRQSSASVPSAATLPTVVGKKNDDTLRILQRSKTLNVVLDVPNSTAYPCKVPSRLRVQSDSTSSNLYQRAANGTVSIEQAPSRISKRSKLTLHSEQQQHKIASPIIQNSAQRYHNSTTINVPTHKVLVHFNYSTNGNRLIPE